MKVTVCFDDAKVVVPCGDGSNTVQYLINEAFQRYKKVTSKTKDFSKLDVNDLKLNLQDGGILDPDDKIADVVEDKEQILASFNGNGIQENLNNAIKSSLELMGKVQGHSSPIQDNINNDRSNLVEDLADEDVYCYVTTEDLQSTSYLHVRNNSRTSISMQKNAPVLVDENSNELSKNNIVNERSVDGLKEKCVINGSVENDAIPIQSVELELISLKNDSPLLGIHVMPEYDKQDLTGLRVRSIEKDGLADKDGRLKCGDVIVEINNVSLYKVDFAEAQEIFKCARNDRELHLKVIHKGGKSSLDVISEDGRLLEHNINNNQEDKTSHDEASHKEQAVLAQQRKKEFASMSNLSSKVKESHDEAATHTMKSVSMNDLAADNFCRNKIYSSVSDDEYEEENVDNNAVFEGFQNSEKIKEIFASDRRFVRSNAYESLKKAVDKSIDNNLNVEDDMQGMFKSIKPNPAKKQHWWSRLKLNKKSKDNSKKKEENLKPEVTNGPAIVAAKSPQPKIKAETNKININNNNINNSSNNNNNNNKDVSDNYNAIKEKQTIEWMYKASWLGSTSDSLTSQTNSPAQISYDINQLEAKINNKGKRLKSPDSEFRNIPVLPKVRSKSAAKSERKELKETHGDEMRDTPPSKPALNQNQSKSYNDLTSKVLQNDEHNHVADKNLRNAGHRGISHYNARDHDRFQSSKVSHDQHLPSRTSWNEFKFSRLPPHQCYSPPNPSIVQEKQFHRHDHHQPENRRLANVLKESPHRDLRYSPDVKLNYQRQAVNHDGLNSFQGNQSQNVMRNSSAFSQVQNPKYNVPYQPQNLHLMPTQAEKKSNNYPMLPTTNGNQDVANRNGVPIRNDPAHRTSQSPVVYNPQQHYRQEKNSSRPYYHHQHHPARSTNHIQSQISSNQLKAPLPSPPISDHFLHHRNDYKPHKNITVNNYAQNIQQQQPTRNHNQQHHYSPQPHNQRFYHAQQSSDVTDYASGFADVAKGHNRYSYGIRR